MKVKQISFSQDFQKTTCQNSCQKSNRTVIHSSIYTNSKPHSPHLNKPTNKRLKYYSQRHKESIATIDDAQLETLREEFMKFDDNKIKSFTKIKIGNKRQALNLITQKYQTMAKTKSSAKIPILNDNNQNLDPSTSVNIRSIVQSGKSPSMSPSQKMLHITTFTSVNPFKNSVIASNYLSENIDLDQNIEKPNKKQPSRARKLSISSNKSVSTILVPEQRLSRHRFTRSSMSKVSLNPEISQKKIDNFLSIDLVTPSKCLIRPSTCGNVSKRSRNQFHSMPKPKTSKRYIKTETSTKEESINPYTNKKYLHVLLQAQKRQLKKLEKIIQNSDPSNVYFLNLLRKHSFQVKTINPEINILESSRTANRTFQEEFMKKVKNLGTNVRKQLKNKKTKGRQKQSNEIHGWEIDTKSLANQQPEPI